MENQLYPLCPLEKEAKIKKKLAFFQFFTDKSVILVASNFLRGEPHGTPWKRFVVLFKGVYLEYC